MFDFEAKINLIRNPNSKLVAFADLLINGTIEVRGFKIFDGRNGLFVANPDEKDLKDKKDENGRVIYYPKVRFHEDTEEGQYRGPIEEEAHRVIIETYESQLKSSDEEQSPSRASASQANTNRPEPSPKRRSSW